MHSPPVDVLLVVCTAFAISFCTTEHSQSGIPGLISRIERGSRPEEVSLAKDALKNGIGLRQMNGSRITNQIILNVASQ